MADFTSATNIWLWRYKSSSTAKDGSAKDGSAKQRALSPAKTKPFDAAKHATLTTGYRTFSSGHLAKQDMQRRARHYHHQ